ncbi:MAG: hypothetical protein IJ379_14405 [Lachnospiraceae bacterium]|nr:hypothetical protein [Lachnospiraceae bacterium]MBQ7777105.1 hypothetical protein [Lachnospiraceae bacterium]
MAVMNIKCDCGFETLATVGDRIRENRICWFQSYHCEKCGKTVELDSVGEIPSEVARAIMEQEGTYSLLLTSLQDRAKAEFVLKRMAGEDLSRFALFSEKETDEIMQGTRNEVLLLKGYLEKKGIKCNEKKNDIVDSNCVMNIESKIVENS